MKTKTRLLSLAFLVSILSLGFVGLAGAQPITGTATVSEPICAISLGSPSTVNFGTLYGGEVIAPSTSYQVEVFNASTPVVSSADGTLGISTGITVSGTPWVGTEISALNTMPVGQTSVLLGDIAGTPVYSSQFPLTGTQSGDIADLSPTASGGAAWLQFGLTVPTGQASDIYGQTITVATTC